MRFARIDLFVAIAVSVLAHAVLFSAGWILQLLDLLEKLQAGPSSAAQAVEMEILYDPPDGQQPVEPPPPVALPAVTPPAPERPEPPRPPPPRARPEPERERARELVKREKIPEHRILQSVDQANPSDEPRPDDPHFLAQSNRDVREETVARARSLVQNDPDPQGARPSEASPETPGTDAEEAARETRDREGVREPDSANASSASRAPPETLPQPGGDARERSAAVAAVPEVPRVERSGIEAAGTGDLPVAPPEQAPGQQGRAGRRGGRGPGQGPDLRLSWSQFSQIYGEGELRRQREEAAELRRTRIRGSSPHAKNWERIRAAIENYVPDVRPGNQTALRSAASPFAIYLTQMHRRIHRLWADGVLVDFALRSDDNPLNDISLVVNLEIVLNADGSVHRVGALQGGSGSLVFDAAAIDTVYRSAPHPDPPREIRSGDGRTYIHWGFYRNQRQCGTFNAEPFILPSPPSMPRDSGEPGTPASPPTGLVPSDAPRRPAGADRDDSSS